MNTMRGQRSGPARSEPTPGSGRFAAMPPASPQEVADISARVRRSRASCEHYVRISRPRPGPFFGRKKPCRAKAGRPLDSKDPCPSIAGRHCDPQDTSGAGAERLGGPKGTRGADDGRILKMEEQCVGNYGRSFRYEDTCIGSDGLNFGNEDTHGLADGSLFGVTCVQNRPLSPSFWSQNQQNPSAAPVRPF